ncbi:MAG: peptide ABC transporter substrate-binding protein [Bdellovibrionales bacterium]|nr:peptide ABC transporter substrate-binding protein [Bdellovibrionales bacterium]
MSCTKRQTLEQQYPKNETLWVNWGTEPPTLDWTMANDVVSNNILLNLMEPLVNIDLTSSELNLLPGLFTKWESDKTYKKWTFHLRQGVLWSDGQPLTIHQVYDGLIRLLKPGLGAEGGQLLYFVTGAEDFHKGKIKNFSHVGIQVIDEQTLLFKLTQPIVFFPKVLTSVNTMPIRKDIIEKWGDTWTEPEHIVTLGPYLLKQWKHDELIVLGRNQKYFGPKAQIPFIGGRMVEDLSSATEMFTAKQIDIQRGITPLDEARFQKDSRLVVQPSLAILYFNFNTKNLPFNNPVARKTIVTAIDRKQVLKVIGGFRKLNTAWLPAGLLGAIEDQGLSYDPHTAQKLFNSLSQQEQKALKRVQLESNTNSTHSLMIQNIQAQLKKNLGIELEVKMEEWKTYLQKISTNPVSLFRLGFISLYPDSHFLMSLWTSQSHFNYTGWSSPKYDQLVQQAASEVNVKKREQLYQRAQKILIDEAPFFNIYSATNLTLVSQRVKNYQPNPLERLVFKEMTLANE